MSVVEDIDAATLRASDYGMAVVALHRFQARGSIRQYLARAPSPDEYALAARRLEPAGDIATQGLMMGLSYQVFVGCAQI
jgi:hypothetical protein